VEVINRLKKEVNAALSDPKLKARLADPPGRGRLATKTIIMTIRRTVFDRDILALDEAELAQAFHEGIRQRQWLRGSLVETSYPGEWLLRAHRERPRRRAAEKRDERAPLHVWHGGLPPLCAISAADWPVRSVFRHLSLPQGARKSLGQT